MGRPKVFYIPTPRRRVKPRVPVNPDELASWNQQQGRNYGTFELDFGGHPKRFKYPTRDRKRLHVAVKEAREESMKKRVDRQKKRDDSRQLSERGLVDACVCVVYDHNARAMDTKWKASRVIVGGESLSTMSRVLEAWGVADGDENTIELGYGLSVLASASFVPRYWKAVSSCLEIVLLMTKRASLRKSNARMTDALYFVINLTEAYAHRVIPHVAAVMEIFHLAPSNAPHIRHAAAHILSILASDDTHHPSLIKHGLASFVLTALTEIDFNRNLLLVWKLTEILRSLQQSPHPKVRLALTRCVKNAPLHFKVVSDLLKRHNGTQYASGIRDNLVALGC